MLIHKNRLPVFRMITEGLLPSVLKVLLYRLRGGRIGSGVKIGFFSVVSAEEISIGDNAKIGFATVLISRTIQLGKRVKIGAMSMMDVEKLIIGDDTRFNEQVYVAGPTLPESRLEVGCRSLIQQHVFINPTKPVTIGNDTVIGLKSSIATHATWPNILEGASCKFEGVQIGNNVYITWQVMILPGVTIEDGATIGTGSIVTKTIPANAVAAGCPARILEGKSTYPGRISAEQRIIKIKEIIMEFKRYLEYFRYETQEISSDNNNNSMYTIRSKKHKKENWHIYYQITDNTINPGIQLNSRDITLSLITILPERRNELDLLNSPWFDIENLERSHHESKLSEELSAFFSRYGIRFKRIS